MAEQLQRREIDWDNLFATPAGEDLPDDAPGDDRVDRALQARSESYQAAGDLDWLLQGVDTSEMPHRAPAEPKLDEDEEKGWEHVPFDVAHKIAESVFRAGYAELPRQAFGGIKDAAQSFIDLEEEVVGFSKYLEEKLPLGGIQVFDQDGNFDLTLLSPEALAEAKARGDREIIGTQPARTIPGGVVRAISQFVRHV
jgi:hypothetical protein